MGDAQAIAVGAEYNKDTEKCASGPPNALHNFPFGEILVELSNLRMELEDNQVATDVLRTKQSELTDKIHALSSRVVGMRGMGYDVARYYRTELCAMHVYVEALEDVLRKQDIPLPCPPADDEGLEAVYKDWDPPTLEGMRVRWKLECAGDEMEAMTEGLTPREEGRVVDKGLDGPGMPARKRART